MANKIIVLLNFWWIGFVSLLTLASKDDPVSMGFVKMIWGLGIIWILMFGLITFTIRKKIQLTEDFWQIKFILFCTILALTEEAIAVTMTNLSPLFGLENGQAYITASANYLDVVLFHSVIIFIPMFLAWSKMLTKYDYSALQGMLLFGITGLFAEIISFGPQNMINAGYWIMVYGLMVYLPIYSLPEREGLAIPGRITHLKAIFLPILFAIPVALIVGLIHPISIHFVNNG